MNEFDENKAKEQLKNCYENAQKLLQDKDKIEKFLQKLEKKLKVIPIAGDTLAIVPIMVSLVKNYVKKEYTDIPLGSIIALISALAYWLSPIDIVPDVIPGIGQLDDAAVIAACLKLIGSDVEDYQKWRKDNNKVLDV